MSHKLGRLAARRPVGLKDLTTYLTNPLPVAPENVTPPSITYQMDGNDKYGDCTLAAVKHLREAVASESNVIEVFPTSDEVVAEYLKLTHGKDTGLVEADVLHTWQTAGLFSNKIHGYAPANHRDLDELKSIIALFGGAYLGVVVTDVAQQQFAEGQAWSVAPDATVEGGHAVPVVGYDANFFYVITWGRTQPVTPGWLQTYLEESWAVLLSETKAVNLATLQADLKRVA